MAGAGGGHGLLAQCPPPHAHGSCHRWCPLRSQGATRGRSIAFLGPSACSPCHNRGLPKRQPGRVSPVHRPSVGWPPHPLRQGPRGYRPGAHCCQPPLALPGLQPSRAPSLPPGMAQPPRPQSQILSADFSTTLPAWCTAPRPGHQAPPWPLSGALWRGAPGGIRQTFLSQFPRPLTPQPPGLQGGSSHLSARAMLPGAEQQGPGLGVRV